MIENAINDFAKHISITNFSLNDKGLASININDSAVLTFEKTNNELLMYLTAKAETYDTNAYSRALSFNHYKHNYPFYLVASVYNDNYILLTRFKHNEVNVALIENAYKFLSNILLNVQKR